MRLLGKIALGAATTINDLSMAINNIHLNI